MAQKFNWGRALGAGLSTLGESMYRAEQEKRQREQMLADEERRLQAQKDMYLWRQGADEAALNRTNPMVSVNLAGPTVPTLLGGRSLSAPVPMRQSAATDYYTGLAGQMLRGQGGRRSVSRTAESPVQQIPLMTPGGGYIMTDPDKYLTEAGRVATQTNMVPQYGDNGYIVGWAEDPNSATKSAPNPADYYFALGNPNAEGKIDPGYAVPGEMWRLYGKDLWDSAVATALARGINPKDSAAISSIVREQSQGLTPDFSYGMDNLAYDPTTGSFYDPAFLKDQSVRQDLPFVPDGPLSRLVPNWAPFVGDEYVKNKYYNATPGSKGMLEPTTKGGVPYQPIPQDEFFRKTILPAYKNKSITARQLVEAMKRYGVDETVINGWLMEAGVESQPSGEPAEKPAPKPMNLDVIDQFGRRGNFY